MKRGAAAALIAAGFGFAGCRQILDVGGFSTGPADAAPRYTGVVDGYGYVSEGCRDCVDAHCEDAAAACRLDPSCAARARCLAGCETEDHDCRGLCAVSTPPSPLMSALTACEAEHCGSGLEAEARCAAGLAVRGSIECNRCLGDRCRDALEAFSASRAALEFEECRLSCTCRGDCPGGVPDCQCEPGAETQELALGFGACCPGACEEDEPDWSCIGRIESLRVPRSAPVLELTMKVENPDGNAVPPVTVQACPPIGDGGTDCTGTSATTNAAGWVSLQIPRPRFGDTYFTHLRVTSDDSDYSAPALFYFFPPVVSSPERVARRMVSRATADFVLRASLPGLEPDWVNSGGIVFSSRSCNENGRGIRLIPQHGEDVLYFRTDGPSLVVDPNAEETASDDGIGFIANLAPGRHELRALRADTGELVGQYSVLVEAGSLTHILFRPTALDGE